MVGIVGIVGIVGGDTDAEANIEGATPGVGARRPEIRPEWAQWRIIGVDHCDDHGAMSPTRRLSTMRSERDKTLLDQHVAVIVLDGQVTDAVDDGSARCRADRSGRSMAVSADGSGDPPITTASWIRGPTRVVRADPGSAVPGRRRGPPGEHTAGKRWFPWSSRGFLVPRRHRGAHRRGTGAASPRSRTRCVDGRHVARTQHRRSMLTHPTHSPLTACRPGADRRRLASRHPIST